MIRDDLDPDDPELRAAKQAFGPLDDQPLDEADSILQVISECLSSLFRVGILIRQPAASTRDRFERATRETKGMFSTKWDVDYVRSKYPKLDRGDLSGRMGEVITKRRQFIFYCRDHAARLAQVAPDDKGDAVDDRPAHRDYDDGGSRVATSTIQSSNATTFIPNDNIMQMLQEETEFLEDDSASFVTSCSVSTISEEMATLKLPRLADLSPNNQPFECPICFTLQPFRSEKAWR